MQIRYPAHLSKGMAFCLCVFLSIRNKTLRVLALALDSGSALAAARWAGMTKTVRSGRRGRGKFLLKQHYGTKNFFIKNA
jgi:hypothetical protein